MVNRVLRDDPSKGDMNNRQGVGPANLWKALTDYHMWPCYLLGLSWILPQIPIGKLKAFCSIDRVRLLTF
jgi:hypothetical protein